MQQSTSALLMVRPTTFGFDEQTGQTNTFQQHLDLPAQQIQQQANAEFDAAVTLLRSHGITVDVFSDPDTSAPKPNAVFPNNWLSLWPNGTVYLYPMATASRRIERSQAALDQLRASYTIKDIIDLSYTENDGQNLESTGVLIFDHPHKLVYACLSERCDEALLRTHAAQLGYTPVVFHSYDNAGTPVYHTNVMMGVQSSTAVVCSASVTDEVERVALLDSLRTTNHDVVEISHAQMAAFCGNVLEVQNTNGEKFLVMSQTAYDNFTPEQRQTLSQDKTLLPLLIPTIETIGGGSARCMLAENFLPRAHE